MSTRERATHGVAFVMQPDTANKVLETDFVSERIVRTRLKYKHRNETIIQICAPCNDTYLEEEKAEGFFFFFFFFEKSLLYLAADVVPTTTSLSLEIVKGDDSILQLPLLRDGYPRLDLYNKGFKQLSF